MCFSDRRLPHAKSGAQGEHVNFALAVGYFPETFAEARQVPHDDNDAAIKVDFLSLQRQEFAQAKLQR
jgi:hypothetical protein